jgi:Ca-activated chloride channel homolog
MKKIFSIYFVTILSSIGIAQTGSLLITSIENESWKPLQNMHIEVFQDSICFENSTDKNGKALFRHLTVGMVEVYYYFNHDLISSQAFIVQENQLFHYNAVFDLQQTEVKNIEGNQFVSSAKGFSKEIKESPQNFDTFISSIDVKELNEVIIVAYKAPLINKDGGASGYTITREDITKLPVRSAQGVAATVGGVNNIEGTDDFNIRGARTDANIYFIDGIKVQGSLNLPKSSINEVKVITGGVPANYGDVTGGVIDITTRSSFDSRAPYRPNHSSKRRNQNNNYHHTEPFDESASFDKFLPIYENDFLSPLTHPHSTFGLDVDKASWGFVKRKLLNNHTVPRDAVKLEEIINSFHYKNIIVPENELLHIEIDRLNCSWNPKNELVAIHLKACDLPKDLPRKSHNFVFLIDISGSMTSADRLPLLKKGFIKFVETLDENDRVSLVTYAGYSGVVLPPTRCNNKKAILEALNNLESGGSTNGIGGIKEAYRLAEENFDPELNNRIILATDGDFNVGIHNPTELKDFISTKRGQGIYLTALGFGMGNYRNDMLESVAKNGDGNHFYISTIRDMEQVLIHDIGNMLNIARDVKLNVEFNPRIVSNYRLIGYESRLLKPKDFNDDTKDAGEIGYNHQVTAVYEIEFGKAEDVENHFVKTKADFFNGDLAFVKLRYKPMEDSVNLERRYHLSKKQGKTENNLLQLAIGLGLELRNSAFKGELTLQQLHAMAKNFHAKTEDEIALKNCVLKLVEE